MSVEAKVYFRLIIPYVQPKVSSSCLYTRICSDNMDLIQQALHRMELLYGFNISKWDKNFLKVGYSGDCMTLKIEDVKTTTLGTKESLDSFLRELNKEMENMLQSKYYSDILKNAESRNFKLQDEFVDDEETVVLTFETP